MNPIKELRTQLFRTDPKLNIKQKTGFWQVTYKKQAFLEIRKDKDFGSVIAAPYLTVYPLDSISILINALKTIESWRDYEQY